MWMSVHEHFPFILIQFEHWISYCHCHAMKELSLYSLSAKVLTSMVFVNVDDYVGKCSHSKQHATGSWNLSCLFNRFYTSDKYKFGRMIACVAWRFWLGALSNKDGRGPRNREEIGAEANALRARISRLRRSCARLDKTAMLRRLVEWWFSHT